MARLVVTAMHGEVKLRDEGLRTRDAHILEWIPRLRPDITIELRSRPEPWPRVTLARSRSRARLPSQWELRSPQPIAIPSLRHKCRWWVQSRRYDPDWNRSDGVIVWNPLQAPKLPPPATTGLVIADLLDDWSVHRAFRPIADEIERAYKVLFGRADAIVANSEATAALAQRFGRNDVSLMPNGCDPTRFVTAVTLHSRITVGYGGKLGHRLDLDAIRKVTAAFPTWRFEFAGPVLIRGLRRALASIPNVVLLGDVHYDHYPDVMRNWDVAWVPHMVGEEEVGGDAIKIYEYRAAGLPVVTTKIIGWKRWQGEHYVTAVAHDGLRDALAAVVGTNDPGNVPRFRWNVPSDRTWEYKARQFIHLLKI